MMSLRAPADYVWGDEIELGCVSVCLGGGSFLKSRAAVNYFPCDSRRSLSRRKRVRESACIKCVWHAQQGFTGRVRDHGSVLIQDRGRRVWLLPHQLECISANGSKEQSPFNHILPYFSPVLTLQPPHPPGAGV